MLRIALVALAAFVLLSTQGLVLPACVAHATQSLDSCQETPGESPIEDWDDSGDADSILIYPSPARVSPPSAWQPFGRAISLVFKPVSITPPHQPPRAS
ncbi:MAG: hypothetical protein M1132_13900 [Chloroflexi bacterium]|nr:hypothetical protein [Chloroflexota bacterium]